MRLYLASTSPARLKTLRAAGIEPELIAPGVDEDAVAAAAGPLTPHEYVQLLARSKAEAVLGPEVDGFVLGGDSAFEFDGTVYGKPHEIDVARSRWQAQRGRSGVLHSGHWLIDHRGGVARGAAGAVSSATVEFADVGDEELEAYLASGEPLEVAGAFTIDSLGAAFVRRVDGDPHAVVGVSIAAVRELAAGFGVPWNAFWNRL